jgi:hypothetical protein
VSSSEVNLNLIHEDAASFTRWALAALRCELEPQSNDVWLARLPSELQQRWSGTDVLRFHAPTNGSAAHDADSATDIEVLPSDAESNLFQWTMEQLHAQGPAAHATPVGQPTSIHELTPALFAPYTFPEGRVYLAGCSLEDRPLVRLTILHKNAGSAPQLNHQFFWPDGRLVDPQLIDDLHLSQLRPCFDRTPKQTAIDVGEAIRAASARLNDAVDEVIATTIVWCKFVEGTLAFEVDEDEESVLIPFSGWARLLADGKLDPPPYHCPLTDQDTYQLSITDDGQIAAAEGIAVCEQTGQKVLLSQLGRCAASGRSVRSELLKTCRTSGEAVLATELVRCAQCDQQVSPNVIKGGRCSACRSLAAVRKDDPRMARLLDEYPKLDRWPKWRICEADQVYVLVAASWLRQLLLVVAKQSLEVSHIATSGRLLTNWSELPSGQREELLG